MTRKKDFNLRSTKTKLSSEFGSTDIHPNIIDISNTRSTTLSKQRRQQRRLPENSKLIDFNDARENLLRKTRVNIIPKNTKQEELLDHLENDAKRIVFALGPAGTGKSYLSVLKAIKMLKNKEISKLILTRPAVSVDEQHGFLPGTLEQKMDPWVRPIFDILKEYYSPNDIKEMLADEIIEISPLAYMRGRTFKNAVIIADEVQNTTPNQMKMLLTRIGEGSRCFVTGDLDQHDRGFDNNGLKDFIQRLEDAPAVKSIGVVRFAKKHIERDPIVAAVLNIYGEE